MEASSASPRSGWGEVTILSSSAVMRSTDTFRMRAAFLSIASEVSTETRNPSWAANLHALSILRASSVNL